MTIAAVIFMGGQALRLNGLNKAELKIGETSCFDRIISVIEPNVEQVVISLAQDKQQSNSITPYHIILDAQIDAKLIGLPSALLSVANWALNNDFEYVVTSSVDTPFLPKSYVNDLLETYYKEGKTDNPVVSISNNKSHGLHTLWPAAALQSVQRLISQKKIYKISLLHEILDSDRHIFCDKPYDPFLNINTHEELSTASKLLEVLYSKAPEGRI